MSSLVAFLNPYSIAILVVIVIYVCTIFNKKSYNVPPGTMGLPYVGETFSLLEPVSFTGIGEYMKQRISRYGKIFSTNVFVNKTAVSADAEMNRFVLKQDLKSFGPPRSFTLDKIFGPWGILRVVGDAHKRQRSCIVEFLSSERIKTLMLEDADKFAYAIVDSWKENTTIFAFKEAVKFSFYMAARRIAGIHPDDVRSEKLIHEYDTWIRGAACLPIYLPGTGYWKCMQSRNYITGVIKSEMEKRREKVETAAEVDDFLSLLMKRPQFSGQIEDLILSVLFAGYDTTAKVIPSAIYFLQGCPKAIAQLREEHVKIARAVKEKGRSKLTWEDYKTMDFTQCVVNETLRLANALAFGSRRATEDVEYKGYSIPKGWNVILHFTSVHFDPSIYDEPEQFNPWRWQSTEAKMTNSFMPFGYGPRMCPGAEVAKMEVSIFLHHLILKYDWELAEPEVPPFRVMNPEFSNALPIKVRPF